MRYEGPEGSERIPFCPGLLASGVSGFKEFPGYDGVQGAGADGEPVQRFGVWGLGLGFGV